MDCRKCQNNISAYVDGQLDSSLSWAIKQHIDDCPQCHEKYKAVMLLRTMCNRLRDVDPPSGFHDRLVDILKRGERKNVNVVRKINPETLKRMFGSIRVSRRVLAGIAAALVVVVGISLAMSDLGGSRVARDEAAAPQRAVPPSYGIADDSVAYKEAAGDRGYEGWGASDGGGFAGGAEMAPDVPQSETSGDIAGAGRGVSSGEGDKTAAQASQIAQDPSSLAERKIIRSAYVALETTEFDRTVDEIIGRAGIYLGYIESSEIQGRPKQYEGQASNRKAHFEIRIPRKSFDQFITQMGELGNVTSRQIRGEDITGQYLDVEARLKSLRLQEERLLTILGKAEQLQDIIELERELSRVRYEIENYTGTLKQWDNMVEYSRVSLDVYEVREIKKEQPVPETWADKIINGFIKSWQKLGQMFADLVVLVVSAIPYIIVLGAIVWAVWRMAKRTAGKRSNIKEEGDNEQ